jgi:hypothetical protein
LREGTVIQFKSERGKKALYAKYLARVERTNRKQKALEKVPFLGVRIDATTVRRHRYLKAHGLNHSSAVASVLLRQDTSERVPSLDLC